MPRSFATSNVRHGTVSGWRHHQRLDEDPCGPCFHARQAYDADLRTTPERVHLNRMHARAQTAALKVLRARHEVEYARLYLAEKRRLIAEYWADRAALDAEDAP